MNARVFSAPWSKTAAQVLLVLAVLLAYGNSLEAPFLFDDRAAILDNPSIRELGSLGAILSPPADGRAVSGRPLVNLSFALNYAWSGTKPWSYHVFNLTVHALAGLLLFGIVRRTLMSRIRTAVLATDRSGSSVGDTLVLSFLVALIWVLHPLQTESVTCIVQRTESLCGLFFLLTLYGFIRGWELQAESSHDQEAPKLRATFWYGLSVLACLLGMGTKEVMVTAPVMVWLYDRTFVTGGFMEPLRRRRGYYLALGGTWVLLAWLMIKGGGTRGSAAGFGVGVSSWSYAMKQCEALVLYLKLSLWPHPLVVDYGTAVPSSLAEVWWQAGVVVALLVLQARGFS
jgi:protein O-mannosyl-transferase